MSAAGGSDDLVEVQLTSPAPGSAGSAAAGELPMPFTFPALPEMDDFDTLALVDPEAPVLAVATATATATAVVQP